MRIISTFLGVCYLTLSFIGQAQAETRIFKHRTSDGVTIFSDTPVENGSLVRRSYRAITRPVVRPRTCRGLNRTSTRIEEKELDAEIALVAQRYTLDSALIKAVARAESCFDPKAVSRAGAQGIMQLMPQTAISLGVTDVYDLRQNLNGGAKYLAQMLKRYTEDTQLALAAYNAGPGNVDRYKGIPPFAETRQYIETVLRYQEHYSKVGIRQ